MMYSGDLWFFSFICLSTLFCTIYAQSGYDYNGGVSLRYPNTSCPTGTFYEGTSFEANCCPKGQFSSPGGSAYCCPSKADCEDHVKNFVKCADPSWIYCPSPDNVAVGFCCLAGWVCFDVPLDGGGHGVGCGPPGYKLSAGQSKVPTAFKSGQGPGQTDVVTKSASGKSTKSTAPTASSKKTSQPTQSSSSLSVGAEAGIGVGAGIVGILIFALLAWFLIRRKRSRPSGSSQAASSSGTSWFDTQPKQAAGKPANIHEMDTMHARYEMDARSRAELAGGYEGHEKPRDQNEMQRGNVK